MDNDVSDEVLMVRVSGGDSAALGTLFERYQQPLFSFLFRLVRDQALAEDVVAETFLRVYEHRTSFKANAKFSTWLYTIGHNLAVDILKRQARQQRYVAQCGLELQQASHGDDDSPFDRYTSAQMVRDAVSTLPDDQRAAIILRVYHELSYREIAKITGATEETIRVRVHRARQALKLSLSSESEGEVNSCIA